jgi:hypothetical protein
VKNAYLIEMNRYLSSKEKKSELASFIERKASCKVISEKLDKLT